MPELDTSVFIIEGDKVKNESGSPGRSQPRRAFGGRQRARVSTRSTSSSGIRSRKRLEVRVPHGSTNGMNTTAWQERSRASCGQVGKSGLEKPAPDGFRESQVHDLKRTFGQAASRGGRVVRGSAGLARSQEWTDHDALLGGRACKPHCCGGEGLRRQLHKSPPITLLRRKAR